jgi:hypothetical protein
MKYPRSDICIDGSLILKMYGLRDNDDVDFLLKRVVKLLTQTLILKHMIVS